MTEGYTRCKVTWYDSPRAGRLALLTLDNGEDYRKPCVFGAEALASLEAAVDAVEAAGDCRGVVLTGKPFGFAAGADLKEFRHLDSPERALEAARRGHAAFGRLRDLEVPTLAAINGVALGGGLEVALHCDYRTLSTQVPAIGFPEVLLSILPGWGGTQLTPRLVGAARALKVIVHDPLDNGRTLKAAPAFELGLADRLIPAVDFLDASIALLERIVTGEERIERPAPAQDEAAIDEAVAAARRYADERVRGATRAPYAAIDLVGFAARGGDLDEGLERERAALAELLPTRQAQAGVYSFQLTQQRVKKAPWRPAAEGRRVRKVGIVGAGLMGAQLAALFVQRLQVPIVLTDVDRGVLERAREHVSGELARRVQRGRLSEGKAAFLAGIVTYTLDVADLAGADFVLEAVTEQMALKQRIFADAERVVAPECVLATNTSSLSVSGMAAGLEHPERVVGFHFFNPPAVMPLLEIVRAERTDDVTLATAFDVARTLRKSAVKCADTPAFILNRILTRFNGAGIAATRHGNAPGDVDAAVKELGVPMGPFELVGFVGVKVAFHTAETLHAAYPERFGIDENFRRLAALDVDGIYDWSQGGPPFRPHAEVLAALEVEDGAEPLTPEEIRQRALEAVAEEARVMLDEGVVADARDIDTALLLGAGFPFFLGGLCKYLDATGVSEKLFGQPLVGEVDRAFPAPVAEEER